MAKQLGLKSFFKKVQQVDKTPNHHKTTENEQKNPDTCISNERKFVEVIDIGSLIQSDLSNFQIKRKILEQKWDSAKSYSFPSRYY